MIIGKSAILKCGRRIIRDFLCYRDKIVNRPVWKHQIDVVHSVF